MAATYTAKNSAATSVIADKTKSAANIVTFIKLGHGEKDQTKKQDMQGQDTEATVWSFFCRLYCDGKSPWQCGTTGACTSTSIEEEGCNLKASFQLVQHT